MVNVHSNKSSPMPEKKGGFSKFSNVVPSPSDTSLVLWRYLDLAKLIGLLNDKKLHFARADVFQDRHEGSVTNSMIEALNVQFADRAKLPKTLSRFRKQVKENTFISCWCMEPESEAMWKLYCGDNYGVAITVVYRDIETSFINQGLVIAPVRYLNYQTEGFPQDNVLYPFFHKRLAFANEREVRIVKWCSDQMPVGISVIGRPPTEEEIKEHQSEVRRGEALKVERGTGISVEFDVEKLIRTIVVHPYAPEWYFRIVKLVVEKFTPVLTGKVKWSSMRTEPLY
ncbi:MAG: hypothetical protein A2Z36_03030 [Chloroflexi bacterium RBG_19FT_COMBO_48_23]|nr:MAG: hypothetical protein A2Z36_03030 [Chloroflexi bacterium RBG_19FT_COMBO_48_23]